jgi:hypothetical protein
MMAPRLVMPTVAIVIVSPDQRQRTAFAHLP